VSVVVRRFGDVLTADQVLAEPAGGGFEYTAFDAMIMAGGLRERRDSVRTISMVHLPTALPDVPGLAEELVTRDVVDMSVLCGFIHWRVHARDLIFVSFPGAGVRTDVIPTVTNLARIAQKFPQVTLEKYGT
jgi:hypothetical protein